MARGAPSGEVRGGGENLAVKSAGKLEKATKAPKPNAARVIQQLDTAGPLPPRAELSIIAKAPLEQAAPPVVPEGASPLPPQEGAKVDQSKTPQAESEDTKAEKPDYTIQAQNEKAYLDQTTDRYKGLADRYADARTEAGYVQGQVTAFAEKSGLRHETPEALSGKSFDTETRAVIVEQAQRHIDTLFNSAEGRMAPEKQQIVTEQTKQYLDLMAQAQAEGDLPKDMDAQAVMQQVENNVWALAFQDRVASENMLGDHGVRHLVDHNIRVGTELFRQVKEQGGTVKAIDVLSLHQVMIDHDMGYAMDPVREPIKKGSFGDDGGHNVLAAKYTRQRGEDPDAPINKIFTKDQLTVIHEGILHHDSRDVKVTVEKDSSPQTRAENLYSIIHTADNTHAFENKLPELMYGYPDSLKTLRLLKTAGDIGDIAAVGTLKDQLIVDINSNRSLAADDKEALTSAARSLKADSYKFSVPRICGNDPEFTVDNKGHITVDVQESVLHQEAVQLFDQGAYKQLSKFIGDTTGEKDVNVRERDEVTNAEKTVTIRVHTGENAAAGKTDYQERIDEIIKDPEFSGFTNVDALLNIQQETYESDLKKTAEGSAEYNELMSQLTDVKGQRQQNLNSYIAAESPVQQEGDGGNG